MRFAAGVFVGFAGCIAAIAATAWRTMSLHVDPPAVDGETWG
jgi:hypothetical protein